MKLSDKPTWDKIIYGLIYPSFLGSMLYELIPATESDFSVAHYRTINTGIRCLIILFYSFDYAHLYGDMDGLIRNPNKKSAVYFVVDVLTCIGYVASFIALKIDKYWPGLIIFGLVPWLFFLYKRKNICDRKFIIKYGIVTSLILVYRCLCKLCPRLLIMPDRYLLLGLLVISVLVYWRYVGWYYEKYSRPYDREVLYPQTG